MLGSSNSKYIDQFFTSGGHNNLDIFYLSQSYFGLPKRTIRNISNKIFLSNQTLKDIENIYRDVGGYDMSYDDFKQLCRGTWKEEYNHLCIDRSKRQIEDDFLFVMKAKTLKFYVILKRRLFD